MTTPPPADQLPGKIELRPPTGKKEDRPLERLRHGLPAQPKVDETAESRD
jgi:hypothetical protein